MNEIIYHKHGNVNVTIATNDQQTNYSKRSNKSARLDTLKETKFTHNIIRAVFEFAHFKFAHPNEFSREINLLIKN